VVTRGLEPRGQPDGFKSTHAHTPPPEVAGCLTKPREEEVAACCAVHSDASYWDVIHESGEAEDLFHKLLYWLRRPVLSSFR
jgi:hypothetical protein